MSKLSLILFTVNILVSSCLAFNTWAKDSNPPAKKTKSKIEHRSHESHSHGSAKLVIAIDNDKGKLEFTGASDSLIGFEHQAVSKEDLSLVAKTELLVNNSISKWIHFEPSLNCHFTKESLQLLVADPDESHHFDFKIVYSINCAKSPKGTYLEFEFKDFSNLKAVSIELVVDELQKSEKYSGQVLAIDLK